MVQLSKFRSYSAGDQARLLTAAMMLLALAAGITIGSFSQIRQILLKCSDLTATVVPGSPKSVRIVWAVKTADQFLPGERTCLVRSLTTETILRLYGYTPAHRIGVDRNGEADDSMMAHSWLELDDEIVIGDLEDLSRYQSLPPLDDGGRS